ncbi:hypothetical protein BJ170DRAFT_324569 [Xylariales sp. AK1849]|nr:hypothetical protein BJ170DRAFT_324569 [Xylariales sp. AK1849]
MACSNIDGAFAPFCAPANATQLTPGQTVIVSWDTSYFGDASALIQIQADFSSSSGDVDQGDAGFTSNSLRAGTGTYGWDVSSSILNNSTKAVDAQLYIVMTASDGTSENRTKGPLVQVVPTGLSDDGSSDSPNLVAIIVPTVLGVLVLMAIGFYLVMKRRNPGWKLRQMVGMGKSDGYGSRKSRAERSAGTMGAGTGTGVQMADMSISKPEDGRNVFREEMRRQDETKM